MWFTSVTKWLLGLVPVFWGINHMFKPSISSNIDPRNSLTSAGKWWLYLSYVNCVYNKNKFCWWEKESKIAQPSNFYCKLNILVRKVWQSFKNGSSVHTDLSSVHFLYFKTFLRIMFGLVKFNSNAKKSFGLPKKVRSGKWCSLLVYG